MSLKPLSILHGAATSTLPSLAGPCVAVALVAACSDAETEVTRTPEHAVVEAAARTVELPENLRGEGQFVVSAAGRTLVGTPRGLADLQGNRLLPVAFTGARLATYVPKVGFLLWNGVGLFVFDGSEVRPAQVKYAPAEPLTALATIDGGLWWATASTLHTETEAGALDVAELRGATSIVGTAAASVITTPQGTLSMALVGGKARFRALAAEGAVALKDGSLFTSQRGTLHRQISGAPQAAPFSLGPNGDASPVSWIAGSGLAQHAWVSSGAKISLVDSRRTALTSFASPPSLVAYASDEFSLNLLTSTQLIRVRGDRSELTFGRHVAPLYQRHCARCHQAGGTAALVLEGAEKFSQLAVQIASAVRERRMPRDTETVVTEQEIELIDAWAQTGAKP